MDFSLRHISDQTFSFNPLAVDIMIYRLLMAILFSAVVFALYYFLNKKFKKPIENTFITLMVGPIICIILLGIGSSVPRAFGLFAALSIIRLRTPIKDTSDMVFIFISVALGICCGAGAVNVALIGLIFFIISTCAYAAILLYRKSRQYFCLEVQTNSSEASLTNEGLLNVEAVEVEFLNKKQVGEKVYLNYFFTAREDGLKEVEAFIKNCKGVSQYSIEKQVSINSFN